MNHAQQYQVSHSHQVSRYWGNRANVKQKEFDPCLVYDLEDDDFHTQLLALTTATHKKDEVAHAGISKAFAKEIYHAMDDDSGQFFAQNLPNAWEIIEDCRGEGESDLTRIDYSELIQIYEGAGILDTEVGRDAFSREGII